VMSRNDADRDDRQPKRVVYEHELAALAAIKEYRRLKFSEQPVPDAMQRQLAEEALAFREVLHKYRREGALDPEWGERDIHWIDDYQNRTVFVEEPSARRNDNSKTRERPAILAVDPEQLVDVIRELEDIADELGFSATIEESTPRVEINDELVEEVEEWRQNNLE